MSNIQQIRIQIQFNDRYTALSNSFQFSNNNFEGEPEIVKEIFSELGYTMKFNKQESFYKLIEKHGEFKFQFNICLRYGNVELIWDLLNKGERLISGPWGVIFASTAANGERPLLPKFRNYDDLKEILKISLAIFEDFKTELFKKEPIQ